ncbi:MULTISPECIES: ArnT family glycosyltransferase [Thermoanaerobacterium]|uniref:Oligosaccharyl transferase STT3 subunit n=2 Tax=Thermoanaerobacterium TaxID=28895 RepID=W9EE05_9THEO|nr:MULTISPECIES: glycosyltransferase family 39 protein [Thermoanaerobacterium]AFK85381.1 oligosaccharyl transferase STT3 subunit [Thermoanaerobacterium saccharolyticum JW/SL-YS485]ETO39446.1 oligosaccharyl transferase STT3 subunit [Thermoanaerobacterium aotearoense SCUT27]
MDIKLKLSSKKFFVAVSLIAVLAIALYLRFLFVYKVIQPPLSGDAKNYDIMVKQFLTKGFLGYMSDTPNAYVTPGYPLFLALIYKIFGFSNGSPLQAIRIVQSVLSVLTVLLIFLIGREIKNNKVGLMAASISAIYPTFVWASTLILTETVYTFVFMVYLYLQIIALKRPKVYINVLTGILFGLAILIRPAAAPLIVIPYILMYIQNRDLNYTARNFLQVLIGFIVIMMPWWIRNIVTLHKLILFATQTWNPMLGGAFPFFNGIEHVPQNIRSTMDVIKFIIKGFEKSPIYYFKWYTIGKFNIIFGSMWYDLDPKYQYLRNIYLLHSFVMAIGWLGTFYSLRKREIRFIGIYAILLTLIQLMFIPTNRYAFSIMPLLIILASYVIDKLLFEKGI